MSIDVYNNSSAANITSKCYRFLKKYSPDKLVALTECGNVPTITKQWNAGAKWLFFAPWYDYGRTSNPASTEFQSTDHSNCNADWWKDAFSCDYVLSREDFKQLREDFATGMEGAKAEDSTGKPGNNLSYGLNGMLWQPNQRGIRIRSGKKYCVK